MASTPTSQITRVVSQSATNVPAANLNVNARFEYSSALTQGQTQGTLTPQYLQVDKTMQLHSQAGEASN